MEARFERAKRNPQERVGSPRALANRMEKDTLSEASGDEKAVPASEGLSTVNEDAVSDDKSQDGNEPSGSEKEDAAERMPKRSTPAIPRTIPLTPTHLARSHSAAAAIPRSTPPTSPASASFALPGSPSPSPLRQTATGTRYGAALGGGSPRSPWANRAMPGTGTPLCSRCVKPVYFAEQVKANGKVFHKPCLRCTLQYCVGLESACGEGG